MKTIKNILFLAIAIALGLPVQAADVAHFLVERRMQKDREKARVAEPAFVDYDPHWLSPKTTALALQAAQEKEKAQVKVVPPVAQPEVEEQAQEFSPFSSARHFVYKYGQILWNGLNGALTAAAASEDDEINPEDIARDAVKPALLTLPADIIREGGKKISKAALGEDVVSPFGDTIGTVTANMIESHYDPAVPRMTKRDVGEFVATDILYALPKATLAYALKDHWGWNLGYPFKKSLDTWKGTFHALVGDYIESMAKGLIKNLLYSFIVVPAAQDAFGPQHRTQIEEVQEAAQQEQETEEHEAEKQKAPAQVAQVAQIADNV